VNPGEPGLYSTFFFLPNGSKEVKFLDFLPELGLLSPSWSPPLRFWLSSI
jgi:hypothetical protein